MAPVAISLNHFADIPPMSCVFICRMMAIAYLCDCEMGCSSRPDLSASHYSFTSDTVTHTNHSNLRELRVWHFGVKKDGNVQRSFWMDIVCTCQFRWVCAPQLAVSGVFKDIVNNLFSHALFLQLTLVRKSFRICCLDWHNINDLHFCNKDTPLTKIQ